MAQRVSIQPQRRGDRGGWTSCQPHQAKRWAILLNGKFVRAERSRHLAEAIVAEWMKRLAADQKVRSYRLGARMRPKTTTQKIGNGLLDNLFADENHREI